MWWNDGASMVPHSTIRRVLLPQLAAPSIPPKPYCQDYALKLQVTTEVATSFAHYKTRCRKFWSVHLSLSSYSSCLVASPVFLSGSRPLRLYTFRRKNSRLVLDERFLVGRDAVTLHYPFNSRLAIDDILIRLVGYIRDCYFILFGSMPFDRSQR